MASVSRFFLRRSFPLLVIVLLLAIQLIYTSYSSSYSQRLRTLTNDYLKVSSEEPHHDSNATYDDDISESPEKNVAIFDKLNHKNLASMVDAHGSSVISRPLKDKCNLYFEQLYEEDSDWKIGNEWMENFNKELFESKDRWIESQLRKLEATRRDKFEHENGHDSETPESWTTESDENHLELKYYAELEKGSTTQYTMINEIHRLAVYQACFGNDDNSSSYQAFLDDNANGIENRNYRNIETKMYGWISRKLPIFVHWTGEQTLGPPTTMESNHQGTMNNLDESMFDNKLKLSSNIDVGYNESFFNHLRSGFSGRGIVMSSADKFFDDTFALIRALRAVGNTMPIQIVHKGDLSPANQLELVKVARENSIEYPTADYSKLESLARNNHDNFRFSKNFPKQDLWFVNVDRCIADDYKEYFSSYTNKLLAYIFNSFEEMLLVDSDIVPYVNPSYFFETSQYVSSHSLFYKDRSHDEEISETDVDFFKAMLPTELENWMFGINASTDKTLKNRYMGSRYKHYMESGVVAINRLEYWAGIPISVQLSFWKPVMERVWGDKELFWLSQSIAGNENYEFNKYHVAAVGPLTKAENRKDLKAKELCATHPGHISSDDDSLVWINSGVTTCKRTDAYERDFESQREKNGFQTKEEVQKFYQGTLKITDAIIPPAAPEIHNELGEPSKGWLPSDMCWGYFWCAYSSIGGSSLPEHQGLVFKFDENSVLWHDYISKIYMGITSD
ncbi:alpha-1,3-mannosyltransferase [Saccharomycopsis crataegensis]|uniref:Alpha-1,3-mannosyltransferase n=1 Tax=Saccharomycopsis crataegensis TaxID=43959 RepID=A0AAV5QTD0_9ASCO|nr:alpha-1,3-mannosyltransferase [Saccharomycopsis crataegensis]